MNDDAGRRNGSEVLESGPAPPRRRWVGRVAVAGFLALVAAAVVPQVRPGDDHVPNTTPTASPSTATGRPASEAAASAGPRGTAARPPGPAPRVTDVGAHFLGVHATWELFVRTQDEVIRVQFARGRVTRTAVPELASSGPVAFVVGRDRAVVRPFDLVPGYVVPDGRRARKLTGMLAHRGPLVPGRDEAAWVQTGNGNVLQAMQIGIDSGHRTGVTVDLPTDSGFVRSDGRGYLLVEGTGGVYDARPDGLHRITTGEVVAAGPTGWLAVECDSRNRCRRVLVDGDDDKRQILPGRVSARASDYAVLIGAISPNGSTAAMLRLRPGENVPRLRLLDLATGGERAVSVGASDRDIEVAGHGGPAWSPDGRLLFVVTSDHRLRVVHARTGDVRQLDRGLTNVQQIAVRGAARTRR
jgi:hypothetical protein